MKYCAHNKHHTRLQFTICHHHSQFYHPVTSHRLTFYPHAQRANPGYYFGQYAMFGGVTMPTQGGQTARPYQEVSPCNGGTFAGQSYLTGGALSKGGAENVLFYYPLYIQPGGLTGKGVCRGVARLVGNVQFTNLQFTIWLRHVAKGAANSK